MIFNAIIGHNRLNPPNRTSVAVHQRWQHKFGGVYECNRSSIKYIKAEQGLMPCYFFVRKILKNIQIFRLCFIIDKEENIMEIKYFSELSEE